MSYIVVWRRSTTSRSLDVQESGDAIAVMQGEPSDIPYIDNEDDLISYVNSTETDARAVEADLAHRILGWPIPKVG